jgi:cytochrome c oxidase subunit 1
VNAFITTAAIIGFVAQLMFVYNFFNSIWNGRKMRTLNPWGATTLEWTTPIHPEHGNWPGEIPHVYRWAYDYAVGDREFIPQTEPPMPTPVVEPVKVEQEV